MSWSPELGGSVIDMGNRRKLDHEAVQPTRLESLRISGTRGTNHSISAKSEVGSLPHREEVGCWVITNTFLVFPR